MKIPNPLKIARDFSEVPAGRFPTDGPFNGEKFRDNLLIPGLKEHGKLTVDFDDVEGFGSSFLEEAFGGLVRLKGYTADQLRSSLTFISRDDESILDEVWNYIEKPYKR